MSFLKNLFTDVKLSVVSAIIAALTTGLLHFKFFAYGAGQVGTGFNAAVIMTSLVILMFTIDYLATYLILYLGRIVGKIIIAFSFICNAVSLYFLNAYNVIIDDSMMGNVFNTDYAEATSYWSVDSVLYLIFVGIIPAVLLFLVKIDYGNIKKFLANIGASLCIGVGLAFGNITNWPWIDKNATVMGSLILPWSYTVNAFRYQAQVRERNRKEILLPDAVIEGKEKKVVVLIIGESARRDHFSLYGYERVTNPLLEKEKNVRCFNAVSAATYTTGGVKAILDHKSVDELYEILPNYLYRSGVDVIWRANNWGQPPLHIKKYYEMEELEKDCADSDKGYDIVLARNLRKAIEESSSDRVFVVLHTSLSHGPTYFSKYQSEFEVFKPVYTSVEMSEVDKQELINAYDNTIVYTDYFIKSVIDELKGLPSGWESTMLFVSDHGESLGEGNLYMHGVPISIAPAEQYEIPFIVWTSDDAEYDEDIEMLTQYHVFHSVLDRLKVSSPVYNKELDIFE